MAAKKPPLENAMTVTELTRQIKKTLEPKFCHIALQGEVSNFKHHSSGHLYFSLKDGQAQISAAMFYKSAAKLKNDPKDGDRVIVVGDISVYPPRGNYQIVVRELYFLGVGELLMRLEQLKREIHQRGWFSKEHKQPIPSLPKTIGIITSPTGAAVQDMLNVLARRFAGLHILLNPVRVQGDGAASEIAKAVEQFNALGNVDVILLGRGGGSIEDLWAFNEEIVAKAVFESRIPIICAVGHETDHCIAEYVADVRAPTPSAAAEIVIAEKKELTRFLAQTEKRLLQTTASLVRHGRQQLFNYLRQPIFSDPYALLGGPMQHVDDIKEGLDRNMRLLIERKKMLLGTLYRQGQMVKPTNRIEMYKQKFHALDKGLQRAVGVQALNFRGHLQDLFVQLAVAWRHEKKTYRQKLDHYKKTVKALDPKSLLNQGYSILFSEKDGRVIKSVHSMEKHETVRIKVSDGEAKAEVINLEPEKQ